MEVGDNWHKISRVESQVTMTSPESAREEQDFSSKECVKKTLGPRAVNNNTSFTASSESCLEAGS
jgi:hypothetical protein